MTEKKKNIREFWDWFKANEKILQGLAGQDDGEISTDLREKLHEYNQKLSFEVSVSENGVKELIISASGEKEQFPSAEDLVLEAPKIEGWSIIPLVPPKGFASVFDFEGMRFDPKEIWFLALTSKADSSALGLQIGIKDLAQDSIQVVTSGVWTLIDIGLGEKISVEEVQHVQVINLPDEPEKQGYVKLEKLTDFINWRKTTKCEDKSKTPTS